MRRLIEKLKRYFQNTFVRYGSTGAVLGALGAILFCVGPPLVIGLSAIGLTGMVAYLDYTLGAVALGSIGLLIFGVWQARQSPGESDDASCSR